MNVLAGPPFVLPHALLKYRTIKALQKLLVKGHPYDQPLILCPLRHLKDGWSSECCVWLPCLLEEFNGALPIRGDGACLGNPIDLVL